MAIRKYTCPPTPPSGEGTFADNLVGIQLTQGGGLTQGNFEFTTSTNEKQNRTFSTGLFSEPFNLNNLNLDDVSKSKVLTEDTLKVYPNFDLTQVTNFTIFGSMAKRMQVSVEQIVRYFPAALESTFLGIDFRTGATAINCVYSLTNNETGFDLEISRIRNPFEIDFTVNATRNLELKEVTVSNLRNMTTGSTNYSLYYNGNEYKVKRIIPTTSLTNGTLKIFVEGNPFSNEFFVYEDIIIRPNDVEVNRVFMERFDEVQKFLLNRDTSPLYTASFSVPVESEDGTYYSTTKSVTWPLYGPWNIDILTSSFENYLITLSEFSESFDSYRTNLVSRFLTTGAFKDFDTVGQKIEKVLQIYGRSFDDTNKFINALAFMNSVNYNTGNDIPSQLLKNLAETLGWNIKMSPISGDDFLGSVLGTSNTGKSLYSGVPTQQTPEELNYQYYKNIILNAAYLFKSKGTRKSIEGLMKLIGAPEALVEFNEHVYLADGIINMKQFDKNFAQISGGTYTEFFPSLDPTKLYTIQGIQYTGFTISSLVQDATVERIEFPVDYFGYPSAPPETSTYFFQSGSGWFEQTPEHRALPQVNNVDSVFTGNNPNYQTTLVPYQYGQDYLDRFRKFPFMKMGYYLRIQKDNIKSWSVNDVNFRQKNDANYIANYFTEDDKLVLNVKNIDLFLNAGQGILYDIWSMSREVNYPIPFQGLNYVEPTICDLRSQPFTLSRFSVPTPAQPNLLYPYKGGVDWTIISPQPQNKTFEEFSQTLMKNTINVRNRQTAKGYPTLMSIFWRYIESKQLANLENNNYNYKNMQEYINGLGDYWIRLVEQMIPGSTIWNAGTRLGNMVVHRQKFKYRRQVGCQIVPAPCNPCGLETNIFPSNCPIQITQCPIYPWEVDSQIQSFGVVLTQTLNSYLNTASSSLANCDLSTISTTWYIELKINDTTIVQTPFFIGAGYNYLGVSYPTGEQWKTALETAMEELGTYGFEYYFTEEDFVVLYNSVCSNDETNFNFKINVGINFNILCS